MKPGSLLVSPSGPSKPTVSVAVQCNDTFAACQALSTPAQATAGGARSTLTVNGPAVVQLPTASQTLWLFVTALASSVPAGTLVCRVKKESSASSASPAPE